MKTIKIVCVLGVTLLSMTSLCGDQPNNEQYNAGWGSYFSSYMPSRPSWMTMPTMTLSDSSKKSLQSAKQMIGLAGLAVGGIYLQKGLGSLWDSAFDSMTSLTDAQKLGVATLGMATLGGISLLGGLYWLGHFYQGWANSIIKKLNQTDFTTISVNDAEYLKKQIDLIQTYALKSANLDIKANLENLYKQCCELFDHRLLAAYAKEVSESSDMNDKSYTYKTHQLKEKMQNKHAAYVRLLFFMNDKNELSKIVNHDGAFFTFQRCIAALDKVDFMDLTIAPEKLVNLRTQIYNFSTSYLALCGSLRYHFVSLNTYLHTIFDDLILYRCASIAINALNDAGEYKTKNDKQEVKQETQKLSTLLFSEDNREEIENIVERKGKFFDELWALHIEPEQLFIPLMVGFCSK